MHVDKDDSGRTIDWLDVDNSKVWSRQLNFEGKVTVQALRKATNDAINDKY